MSKRKTSTKSAPAERSGSDPLELNPRKRGPAPEWLPDWRDESLYPWDKPLDMAWQFVRRSPEYWHDYLDCVTQIKEHRRPDMGRLETLMHAILGHPKWGVPLENPGMAATPALTMRSRDTPPFYDRDALQRKRKSRAVLLVGFDVRFSLDDQLEAAKRYLMNSRRLLDRDRIGKTPAAKQPPVRPAHLRRYLRAYDAAWSGAKDADIVGTLNLADVRDAQRYIRKAQDYIGGEYRTLLSAI